MAFEVGRSYAGYEFLGMAGKTGTTVAYRVRNTAIEREERLYVLTEVAHDDPRRRDRFLREMGLRARLQHPYIPAFLNATELEGQLIMTTEPVQGRPLGSILKDGPLPWPDAVALTRQVLSALSCAHEFEIVHRGISDESILLAEDGTIQLANFELAKGTSSPQLTQAGAIFGNARYISPEQSRGTGELDCRSDIYSVGAVLYHMLAGRPPFHAATEFELMLAHVKETPAPPSAYCDTVPAGLDAIVLKAMAKEPAGRYPDCAAFDEALQDPTAAPVREARPVSAAPPRAGLLESLRQALRSCLGRRGN